MANNQTQIPVIIHPDPAVVQLQQNVNKVLRSLNSSLSNLSSTPYLPEVKMAFCTETQFQASYGTNWILCDGRNVAGSSYSSFPGNTNFIPDMRATFPRMKDNGRGLDPNGDLALGTYEADQFDSHTHGPGSPIANYLGAQSGGGVGVGVGANVGGAGATAATGGSETAPKATVINMFIRIN